ncbi:MAG TPA: IPT/TIG domain-containing protein, partial [Bryobacteraceae bacterium]|nr:IPT/TIG domain-containing protein [Bryobacteraceae bacterium]
MPDPPYTPELEARLEAYFSSLRASPLRDVLKHASANWRLYAAVTGSALAMSHGAPLLAADADPALAEPAASVLPAHRNAASSRGNPLIERARQAILKASDQTAAPAIAPGGIAPIFGRAGTIQPGEWVTIYGTGLATGTFNWNGDFPVTLGGTSVTINNKPAYLMFVSPGQINLQAPDDTATGTVPVVVATPAGSTTVTVTLSEFAPAFSLIGQQDAVPHFVSGIILRPNGTGAYGNGSYDILGPGVKSFGFPNTPAEAGDSVEIYGVGFGPTTPAVPAGQVFSGAAPLNNPVTLYINGVVVPTTFAGLSSAGVVQINFTVPPGLGEGSV